MKEAVNRYLSKTFPNIEVKIRKDKLKTNFETTYSTPLFNVNYYNYSNSISFSFDYKDFPVLYLRSFLGCQTSFAIKEEETERNERVVFQTNGFIPYRWFDIIKDFCDDTIEYSIIQEINYKDLIEPIPTYVFDRMIYLSHQHKSYYLTVDSGPNKGVWYTKDGNHSPVAESVLKDCNKFLSVQNKNRVKYPTLCSYGVLFAAEGGIEIFNDYIDEWISFSHSGFSSGSIRNECRGVKKYSTSKDVKPEELMVLYLCLNRLGCQVSFDFN